MKTTFALALTLAAFVWGQAQAQGPQPVFAPGDLVENDLTSGGCPTHDGIVAVLVALAQTGRAHDTMVRNDCLPYPAKMKHRVEEVLSNNILRVTDPDFPGSPPMFVSGSSYNRISTIKPTTLNQTPSWFSDRKVNAAMASLSLYQDVPSSANCMSPRSNVEHLICSNPNLKLAENLNTRADIYATENATKRELNHRRFKGKLPLSCSTEDCVFDSFRSSTNDFLGGESPYQAR